MSFTEHNVNGVIFDTAGTLSVGGVRHAFTTRHGGVSPAPFDSLNLASNRGDHEENILENYRRLGAAVGFDASRAVGCRQIHSDLVRVAREEDAGKLRWDERLLEALQIPASMLPEVRNSSEVYGTCNIQGVQVPIAGIAGDQQAALFGQGCFKPGDVKNTYGTGCFLLMNTGHKIYQSKNGLVTTIAISLDGEVEYALEGSVFVGGAVIQWIRDGMHLIQDSCDSEYYAQKVPDNGGVYIVPAFTGLGAPYWDMYARGAIVGITRGTTQNHIIRAAEESIAYQSADLMWAMEKDTDITISTLKVDGGASRDHFLMQFQSDILNKEVLRPAIRETTALGAAYLAGLATGVWKSREEISHLWSCNQLFEPKMDAAQREELLEGWHKAVGRSQDWAEHEV